MTQTFLRLPKVMEVTGLARSTVYDLMAAGKFPKPIPITDGRVGWVESEISAWQRSRIEARDGAAAA